MSSSSKCSCKRRKVHLVLKCLVFDCLNSNSKYELKSQLSPKCFQPALSSANSGNCKSLLSFLKPTHLCKACILHFTYFERHFDQNVICSLLQNLHVRTRLYEIGQLYDPANIPIDADGRSKHLISNCATFFNIPKEEFSGKV